MSSDGTRKTTSPGTRSGSRLVATIVTWGAARSSASTSDAVAASTCSQLSRTRSIRRGARNPITASTRSCPGSARRSSEAATASGISRGSVSSASSTNATPASNAGSAPRPSSRASRVFPVPPVPQRVRSRVCPSSDRSSASSRSRPTNELVFAGSPKPIVGPNAENSCSSSTTSAASSSRRVSAQSSYLFSGKS